MEATTIAAQKSIQYRYNRKYAILTTPISAHHYCCTIWLWSYFNNNVLKSCHLC